MGDSVEVESLGHLLLANSANKSIAIGSVKSMIGHTKSTAGLAGMIKVALGLYHKILPPTLVDQLNPKLNLDESQIYVNGEARPWMTTGNVPRRAGVSAFGFGGVNFHTVLEEYQGDFLPAKPVRQHWPAELFLWRASDPEVLSRQLVSYKEWLATITAANTPPLRDLAFSLYKDFQDSKSGPILAIVANAIEDLTRKIRLAEVPLRTQVENFEDAQGVFYAKNPSADPAQIAFLFPGQGSQYPNMARELALYFPQLRATFEQANTLLQDHIPGLTDYIFPPPAFTEEERRTQKQALTATQIAQPALGATDLALSRLLKDMDVHPAAVAGHSYGEIVALHEAGVIDEASLFAISEARGRMMAEAAGPEAGTMAAISTSPETAAALLGSRDGITLANLNAPNQTVISGSNRSVEKAVDDVQAMGMQAQLLPVACAFHSPLVAPAGERLADFLQTVRFNPPQKQVFSNTTGKPYPYEPEAIRQLLSEHLARPVLFQKEIEAMYAAGIRIFVETGPRAVLTGLVKQILGDRPHLAVSVDQPGRFGLMAWLKAVGQLTAAGIPVNLASLFEGRAATRINFEKPYPSPEQTYGPTTWLVSGGKAVPWQTKESHPEPVTLLRVKLAGETPTLPENIQPPMRAAQPTPPTLSPSDLPPADEVGQVLMQYQQVMSQFLETQKSIMLAYLGTAPENTIPPLAQTGQNLPITTPTPAPGQGIPSPPLAGTVLPEHDPTAFETASTPVLPDDGSNWPTEKITAELLTLISERTGYPVEMLDLDANLEGDLGIDSIKRVEILSVFQERHPWLQTLLADDGLEHLQTQKTIRAISEWISTRLSTPSNSPIPQPTGQPVTSQPITPSTNISRFTLSIEDLPLNGSTVPLPKDRVMLITDDGLGISRALAGLLTERGHKVVIATTTPSGNGNSIAADFSNPATTQVFLDDVRRIGQIGALIHLAPLRSRPEMDRIALDGWKDYFQSNVMSFFNLVRGIHDDLISTAETGEACVLIVTEQGGMFAGNDTPAFIPGDGGLVGMLKTIAHELPSVRVRAIDFNQLNGKSPKNIPPDFVAEAILKELTAGDGLVEVGYDGEARKTVIVNLSPLTKRAESLNLDENSVILLTGGARGITAEIAKELAERYRPTLILLGRSPLP
ncbi:MAG TPA: SDR family NAD(P)-dependent oxidoreductase, partial [Anaerolineales bacterium]|nr:SDR family NAD(P)-dependent oxidoreductase [Anaerolineales bacterium]